MRSHVVDATICCSPADATLMPAPRRALASRDSLLDLIETIEGLSQAHTPEEVAAIACRGARRAAAAAGAAFLLHDGDNVRCLDEDAASPVWKGPDAAAQAGCFGLSMRAGRTMIVPNIDADPRVPLELTGRAEMRSLVLTPAGSAPAAAIAAWWATPSVPGRAQVDRLAMVARAAATALANIRHIAALEHEVREIDHRIGNLFTAVLAISRRTRGASASLEAFSAAFEARIAALAAGHGRLARRHWRDADLEELVMAALAPYACDGAAAVDGPRVSLPAEKAMGLLMICHELATNAVKHGALGAPDGRVEVGWRPRRDGPGEILDFEWRESGGPPVVPPTRRGFGFQLLLRGLQGGSQADARLEFRPDGLRYRLAISL